MAEAAVEAEGVVEVEAEGGDDGGGEVLEGPAARELDVAVEAAAQGGAEDACARIGHARLLAGGDAAAGRAPARAGRRGGTEGRIRPPSSPGARGSSTALTDHGRQALTAASPTGGIHVELAPDRAERLDQPVHRRVVVQRRGRDAQPLGAARDGREVDRLEVDAVP